MVTGTTGMAPTARSRTTTVVVVVVEPTLVGAVTTTWGCTGGRVAGRAVGRAVVMTRDDLAREVVMDLGSLTAGWHELSTMATRETTATRITARRGRFDRGAFTLGRAGAC